MKTKNWIIGGIAVLGAATAGSLLWMKIRATIPSGVEAVEPFDAESYLGKWYEIARMPMRYENGLTRVTAHYSLNPDGTISVINRGFNAKKMEWEEAHGKAKFVDSAWIGMLKVSFFGPFYAGYNVIAIDEQYQYALVFGRNLDYMWLLSREKTMPKRVEQAYLKIAQESGYDLSELVWTEQ